MWYNPIMVWLLQSPLHGMLSGSMMVIEYKGKKSGRTYHLPVGYKRISENLLTVSYKRRTWWRNLRGGVHVNIRLQGKDVSGQAEVVEDEHGVAEGLMAFIDGNSRAAHMFGILFNTNDQPEPESLKQAAIERVIVRTILV